jgi:hypothetical protein
MTGSARGTAVVEVGLAEVPALVVLSDVAAPASEAAIKVRARRVGEISFILR